MLNGTRLEFSRLRAIRRLMMAERTLDDEGVSSARVLCIASGKGGTGKSILASNLACLRAAREERVCLIDFDAGLANAHLLLGVTPRYDLGHVLNGEVSALDALVEGPSGIQLLSGGVGRHALANPTRRELDRLFKALKPLEHHFDLVLVDHGAGMTYSTVAHLAATSTLLMVTNPEVTALSDAYALYKRAHTVNPHVRVGVVINRAPDEEMALAAWDRFKSAAQRFLSETPQYVGWIPYDENVIRSVQVRQPVTLLAPESRAAQAMFQIANWDPIETARTQSAFYDRARRALR